MKASYTRKELCNEEEPLPDLSTLPSEEGHRMPDGSIHSIQVGLRMVEEFRLRCKEAVEEDPLEKIAVVYEGELTKIKSQLDAGNLEEFIIALCPTLSALYPSLYRYFLCLELFIALKSVKSKNQPPFYHEIIQLERGLYPSNSSDPGRDRP